MTSQLKFFYEVHSAWGHLWKWKRPFEDKPLDDDDDDDDGDPG